jgi:hypothetical protein
VRVRDTIKVTGVFDGHMKLYYGVGDGSQDENQPPMFEVADGGTVSNVVIGPPAGDGIHCLGSCRVLRTWFLDVGEDAITAKGTAPNTEVLIDGGGARLASDKVVQHNGAGTVAIKNYQVDRVGKLYRSCGNCKKQFKRRVNITNVFARDVKWLAGVNEGDETDISDVLVYGKKARTCSVYRTAKPGSEPRQVPGSCNLRNVVFAV